MVGKVEATAFFEGVATGGVVFGLMPTKKEIFRVRKRDGSGAEEAAAEEEGEGDVGETRSGDVGEGGE